MTDERPAGISRTQLAAGGTGVASIIGALIFSLSSFDESLDSATERMLSAGMEQKLAMQEMGAKIERNTDAIRALADTVDGRWSRMEMHQYSELLEAINRDIGLKTPDVLEPGFRPR